MKILHITSSPRGKASYSIQLGNIIVEKLQASHPGSTIIERDLNKQDLSHLAEIHSYSFFIPAIDRTPEQSASLLKSDEIVAELQAADAIVISTPLYNFSITSALKVWIDHITRAGITFSYSEKGVEGLVKGKKVFLSIATGGIYSEGPMKEYDFSEPYLRKVLGFIGMNDITTYRVEGTSIPQIKETALEKAINSIAI